MKWKAKHKIFDTKEKRVFLLFPKRVGNEIRWLEYATIKYNYYYKPILWWWGYGWDASEWV